MPAAAERIRIEFQGGKHDGIVFEFDWRGIGTFMPPRRIEKIEFSGITIFLRPPYHIDRAEGGRIFYRVEE